MPRFNDEVLDEVLDELSEMLEEKKVKKVKKVWLQVVNATFYVPYSPELTEQDRLAVAKEVFKMKSDDIDFFEITLSPTVEATFEVEKREE